MGDRVTRRAWSFSLGTVLTPDINVAMEVAIRYDLCNTADAAQLELDHLAAVQPTPEDRVKVIQAAEVARKWMM